MQEEEYINNPQVQQFITWLNENLESDEFAHQYVNQRTNQHWGCGSLLEAYQNYSWPFHLTVNQENFNGYSFYARIACLEYLGMNLQEAINDHNDPGCLIWCNEIFGWGGVIAHNANWVNQNLDGLTHYFEERINFFQNNPNDNNLTLFDWFTSGTTKIYSVLVNDFIIYDTRVGAGLGLAVRKYCEQSDQQNIPAPLRFRWGPARNPNLNRNPSAGPFIFPHLYPGHNYAQVNLRANWLLKAVINQYPDSCFAELSHPLHALEAAFFMIGYDLGNQDSKEPMQARKGPKDSDPKVLCDGNAQRQSEHAEEKSEIMNTQEFNLETRGTKQKRRRFKYTVTSTGINFVNEKKKEDFFSRKELFNILNDLYEQFGDKFFKLANNVAKMGKGEEERGLGMTILNQGVRNTTHAQNASYLGVIFEELGLVQWNGLSMGIKWRLFNSPSTWEEFNELLDKKST